MNYTVSNDCAFFYYCSFADKAGGDNNGAIRDVCEFTVVLVAVPFSADIKKRWGMLMFSLPFRASMQQFR